MSVEAVLTLLLAGPTPRSTDVEPWRPEASSPDQPAASSRRSAARLGWRQTDSVRRQRWFKAEDGQLAPVIQQALRQIDAGAR